MKRPVGDQPEDLTLIDQIRAGDRGAFAQLVSRHYPIVERIVQRVLGADADSADVVQEVFVRLLQKIDTFRGDSAFSTWLARVAINCCRSQQRWAWMQRRAAKRWFEQLSPSKSEGHASEEDQDVHAAVARLPLKYREVVILRYFEGLSAREISEVLHLTEAAVETRLTRARRRLQETLRPPAVEKSNDSKRSDCRFA